MSDLEKSKLSEDRGVPSIILAGNYESEDEIILLIDATFINDTTEAKCHARFKLVERGALLTVERLGASVQEI